MDDLETWLERVYDAGGDHQALESAYDEWAADYDRQLWASGNPYIAIAAGFAGRLITDFDARILDAGCGTGNMAQILRYMGYTRIDGLEPSAGMRKVAANKGLYDNLYPHYLDTRVDLPDASYDAVVAAGVLTHGHAPPAALDGILQLLRDDGVVVFSLSKIAHEEMGFREKIEQLEASGRWQKVGQSELFRTYPFSEQEAHLRHWVMAFRKSGG